MWLFFFMLAMHMCLQLQKRSPKPQCQRLPNDGKDQMPTLMPFRSVSKPTQHRPAALVDLSTASDSLAEDHISVILFLCFGEDSSVLFVSASLSRDETGEWTSDLKIYAAFLLGTVLNCFKLFLKISFKLFLPLTYLPFYCHPIPHASPSNMPSVSCRIYLTAPE